MVERLFLNQEMPAGWRSGGRWNYWRPAEDGLVELGTVHGSRVGLPTHFHSENQITFVLSGRRRFIVEGDAVDLAAGRGVCIPAGVPHRSLAEPFGVVCLNAYVPAGEYAVAAMMREIERLWRQAGHVYWNELAEVIRRHRLSVREIAENAAEPVATNFESVSQASTRMRMSREGFTRMFAKRYGMSPHAFWLMGRLNRARELLRAGEAIAAVAADNGFADQSHFGRWFRRAFGITPGRYRSG